MIDGLLIKFILREASEGEMRQVDEWVSSSAANRQYYEDFKKIWEGSRNLAVHGTVNDLAVGGARPLFLSAAFILEEGLALSDLNRIAVSMREACREAGVALVTVLAVAGAYAEANPRHHYGGLHLTSHPPLAAYLLLAVPSLALIWRNSRPVEVLGLAVAGAVGWAALGQIDGAALVPVMVALCWVALTRPRRIAVSSSPPIRVPMNSRAWSHTPRLHSPVSPRRDAESSCASNPLSHRSTCSAGLPSGPRGASCSSCFCTASGLSLTIQRAVS